MDAQTAPIAPIAPLRQFGTDLRAARKRAGMTQAQLAARARIGRQKLIQIEQGRPGVAFGTCLAAAQALGLQLDLTPARVQLDTFPQLRRITWNRRDTDTVTEAEALALYERNWHHVDQQQMPAREREFLQHLIHFHGGGVFHA